MNEAVGILQWKNLRKILITIGDIFDFFQNSGWLIRRRGLITGMDNNIILFKCRLNN